MLVIALNFLTVSCWPFGQAANDRFLAIEFAEPRFTDWPVWRNVTDRFGSIVLKKAIF